jgi:hypothetical protein
MDDFEMDYERFEDDLYEWETEQVFQDGVLDREEEAVRAWNDEDDQ